MQCYQLDFPDGDWINPAYALQISFSYVLSDITTISGHTTMMLYFEHHFKKRTLIDRAHIVYDLQKNEPEARAALENFFTQYKKVKAIKHPPALIFLAYKKLESTMDKVLKDWVNGVCEVLEKNGFYAFSRNFKPGILNSYYLGNDVISGQDLTIDTVETFSNKLLVKGMDKIIWLMAEGFYSYLYFGEGAITSIDAIEEGKPYLIKSLKIPNINLLSCEELDILRETIAKLTSNFRAETDAWATQCYTAKSGGNYFKEKLMPLMATVQGAIDNDPLLQQWRNIDSVKNTSAIYFGEVSPLILWKYYKNNLILSEEIYNQLIKEYKGRESYTIPVMVFAYHLDALKLQTWQMENGLQNEWVGAVKKYAEI